MLKKTDLEKLNKTVSRFSGAKVLVIGDLILDEFIWGDSSRISPEAPVPVVLVGRESMMPGGAANVASNISSIGAKAYLAGVIGRDAHGRELETILKQRNVDLEGVISDPGRPTTLKTRVVARHQQVVRIDRESAKPLAESQNRELVSFIKSKIKEVDGVIMEDYGKGVITPGLLKEIVPLARKYRKIITVDPKEEHISYYKGVTAITPNRKEAEAMGGIKAKDDPSLNKLGKSLLERLKLQAALITLGENGMRVFERGGKITQIPTIAQEVFDVSGAGDTVIATFTTALCAGAKMIEAAHISNFAGGIVVGKVGVASTSQAELKARIRDHHWQP
ncbi:MAG: D-glycero-beta-D-manno-heptose-7-phosphate kinase [Candidatus Omnitrophica bacterium]|nr:D-glycero-beta-D-manno-heptose-7-phosphate kinase [Candidatus Omnitrophota bacterium]MDD5737214.1 D-glycero-beta-D-manno-heptose-7-phosphate kinase [Candidatus Omnitrophota bacterium]